MNRLSYPLVDTPWIAANVSDQIAGARIQSGLDSTIDLVGVYSANITTADFI